MYTQTRAEQEAKAQARQLLPHYLESTGRNPKSFSCFNKTAHNNNDQHPSMYCYNDNGIPKVYCRACGAGGDIFDLIGAEYNLVGKDKFYKAYEVLSIPVTWQTQHKDFFPTGSEDAAKHRPPRQQEEPKQEEPRPDFSKYLAECAGRISKTDYHRGISLDTLKEFHVGYDDRYQTKSLEADNYAEWGALIIPTGDNVHSFIARNTNPKAGHKDRMRVAKGTSKEIWNIQALHEQHTAIIVTEGEIDALSVYDVAKHFGGSAIGLGSVTNTKRFIKAIEGLEDKPKRILLALDNDTAGQRATEEIIKALKPIGVECIAVDICGGCKDPNEALTTNRDIFSRKVQEVLQMADAEKEDYRRQSAGRSIDRLFDYIKAHAEDKPYPTGFKELDEVFGGGLYEGVYAIGAGTSAGKTALTMQITDNVAKNGFDVLYVSLEMGTHELMSRSISRETLLYCLSKHIDQRNAKTSRGILAGHKYKTYTAKEIEVIDEATTNYKAYADNIYYWEGVGSIGIDQIRERVKKHIELTNKKPLLAVDYLQILAPHDVRASDKTNVDYSIIELKRLSRDYHIPVLIISSFNRANYKTEVDFESFKESGGIDYGCDAIIGMQLKGTGEQNFKAKEAKAKTPREIELHILKNRNGEVGKKIDYRYYTRFNFFAEVLR